MYMEVELDWRRAIVLVLDWSERMSKDDKQRVSLHQAHLLEVAAINIKKAITEREATAKREHEANVFYLAHCESAGVPVDQVESVPVDQARPAMGRPNG